jgi:hypothetical protein
MALPEPERGLVISYSYLWSHEAAEGAEEGRKNRPCVIVAGVKRVNDEIIVTVFPITHHAPNDLKCAVEIPAKVKEHLGLDADRSWWSMKQIALCGPATICARCLARTDMIMDFCRRGCSKVCWQRAANG